MRNVKPEDLPPLAKCSDPYHDDIYEYLHIILSYKAFMLIPKNRLLSEREWGKDIGIKIPTFGWHHYGISNQSHM